MTRTDLPRTSEQQYTATIRVNKSYRRLGDLVFFYTGSSVWHVGDVHHVGV